MGVILSHNSSLYHAYRQIESTPEQFEIKFREFDRIRRHFLNVKTVVRAAVSESEARNKILIAFDRCQIMSCVPRAK
jgi:hypothetical protein